MLRFLADEDLDQDILRGLERREPTLDVTSVHEARRRRAPDPEVLAWAALEGRVVLTHDRNTMPKFTYERVRAGKPMPGLFVVSQQAPIAHSIDDILIAALCSNEDEWEGQVLFLPFPRWTR